MEGSNLNVLILIAIVALMAYMIGELWIVFRNKEKYGHFEDVAPEELTQDEMDAIADLLDFCETLDYNHALVVWKTFAFFLRQGIDIEDSAALAIWKGIPPEASINE